MHAAYIRPGGVAQDMPIGLMDDSARRLHQCSATARLGEVTGICNLA